MVDDQKAGTVGACDAASCGAHVHCLIKPPETQEAQEVQWRFCRETALDCALDCQHSSFESKRHSLS